MNPPVVSPDTRISSTMRVTISRETHQCKQKTQRPGPQQLSSATSSEKTQRKWTRKNISPRFTSGKAAKQLSGFQLELYWGRTQVRCPGRLTGPGGKWLITATSAARTCAGGAASFTCLVAIPAKYGTVASWFKGHCGWLTAAGTDHGCSLCRSRTVAGTSTALVVLLCHSARLATLRRRVTAFLKERLISSGEGKILPTIAAS